MNYKSGLGFAAAVFFLVAGSCFYSGCSDTSSTSKSNELIDGRYAQVEDFLALSSRVEGPAALTRIDRYWHPGSVMMLLEVHRLSYGSDFSGLARSLELKTGVPPGSIQTVKSWMNWVWNREYQPHPQYAEFKRKIYTRVDESFARYFEKTETAEIRLDEIIWGGVERDGIPPLKNPAMISADDAVYLDDTNVVFGISLNGDNRCYPKRILAWHEMFKDTIGGESVCGVY